jgi:hypothetical protein
VSEKVRGSGDLDGPGSDYRMPDEEWDRDQRNETTTERLDRNWVDLLQELRVVQTGVQLLTGFLLTLPFQQRFTELSSFGRVLYIVTVAASVLATGLLVAPVMIHRLLFRRHARDLMVTFAHRLAVAGTTFLGVAMVGVVLLVFDVVFGRRPGVIAASIAALMLLTLWCLLPLMLRRGRSGG